MPPRHDDGPGYPDVVTRYLATARLVSLLSLVHPGHAALLRLELIRAHGEFTLGRSSNEEFARLVDTIGDSCLADRALEPDPASMSDS